MAILKFPSYDRDALKNIPESDLRAEYRRLQKIANKRLKNLAASEFSKSNVYLKNRNKFRNVSEIKTKSSLVRLLSDLGRFVGSKTSSVRGMQHRRRESIKELRDNGITWVNIRNFDAWVKTIQYIKAHNARNYYPTNEVMKDITQAVAKGMAVEKAYKIFMDIK